MKKIVIIFTIFVLGINAYSIDKGDSIKDLIDQYSYDYSVDLNRTFPDFDDISIIRLQYSREMKAPMLLAAVQNEKIIGIYAVLEGTPENGWYLFDLDGDGILDYKSDKYFYPNWLLFRADIKRDSIDSFMNLTYRIYMEINSIDGPDDEVISSLLGDAAGLSKDPDSSYRDCFFSLYSYYLYIKNENRVFATATLINLVKHLEKYNYDQRIVGVLLMEAESDLAMGRADLASKSLSIIKALDGKSLIADYYLAYIASKYSGDDEPLNQFRTDHPGFWMFDKS